MPYNTITNEPYNGQNIDTLLSRGYDVQEWGTFLQWRDKGYKVRKGEKGTRCMTFGTTTKLDKKTGKQKVAGYMKGFVLFNVAQVELVA